MIGRLLLDDRLPVHDLALAVTSRASFEIVQKAWAAGFSALVAVAPPTALAVTAARRAGLTLAGFARDGRLNLYAPERLPADGRADGESDGLPLRRARRAPARSSHRHHGFLVGHPSGQSGEHLLMPLPLPSTSNMRDERSSTRSVRSMSASSPAGGCPPPR